jgi:hypothetical protein
MVTSTGQARQTVTIFWLLFEDLRKFISAVHSRAPIPVSIIEVDFCLITLATSAWQRRSFGSAALMGFN